MQEEFDLLSNTYAKRIITYPEAEFNALYQDLPVCLWEDKVVLFHGVLISLDDSGYLFTAPSGVGKSTHAGLWKSYFKERAEIINGDKILLRVKDDGLWGYGSPWKGKENIGNSSSVRLKAICLLERGRDNVLIPLGKKAASNYGWLIEQVMLKNRQEEILRLIQWLKNAIEYVDLYQLHCNMKIEAAITAYNGMNNLMHG